MLLVSCRITGVEDALLNDVRGILICFEGNVELENEIEIRGRGRDLM